MQSKVFLAHIFALVFIFLRGVYGKGVTVLRLVKNLFLVNEDINFKIEYFIVCLSGLMVQAIQLVQVIQEGQVVQLSPCLYFDHAVLE